MKTIGKTFLWIVGIVTLLIVAGGVYVYRVWTQQDELLHEKIVATLANYAPEWQVRVGRCHFDFRRNIHIDDCALKVPGQSLAFATVPKIKMTVDRHALAERQEVHIHKVRLLRPSLIIQRDCNGRWNWQSLPIFPKSQTSLPEFEIEQGTITIKMERETGGPATMLMLSNVNIHLVPSAKRHFLFEVAANVPYAQTLKINGRWNVDDGTGTANGELHNLNFGTELLDLLTKTIPEFGVKLADMQAKVMENLPYSTMRPLVSQAEDLTSRVSSVATPQHDVANRSGKSSIVDIDRGRVSLRMSIVSDIKFRISRLQPDAPLDLKLLVHVEEGEFTNPILPFPLKNLSGKIYCDNHGIIVRHLTGNNGPTRLDVQGVLSRHKKSHNGRFTVNVTNLALDHSLRSLMPVHLKRTFDMHQPSGHIDVQVVMKCNDGSNWHPEDVLVTAQQCSAAHVSFPYRIENITGTIRQQGHALECNLQGLAGSRSAVLIGHVQNAGPAAASVFDISIEQLPVDQTFRDACQKQPELGKVISSLNFTGTLDAQLRLLRPPGLNKNIKIELSAGVYKASIQYEDFPYEVDDLSGTIRCRSEKWTFSDLKGRHGASTLTGYGSYNKHDKGGKLNLTVKTKGTMLDQALYVVLSPKLKELWQQFSPTGTADVTSVIHHTADQPVRITLPDVELSEAGILMPEFPYRIDQIRASFSYDRDFLTIRSLVGRHHNTQIHATGFAKFSQNGDWTARLVELTVDELEPDELLLRALPNGLHDVFECLDPQQTISMKGMLELRGTQQLSDPITAAWDIETILSGGTVTAGLVFKDVYGGIESHGWWNGHQANLSGRINLKSATVLGYRLADIQGPFGVKNQELIIGSRGAVLQPTQRGTRVSVDVSKHVTARAINGIITVDAIAALNDEMNYRAKLNMSHGSLEEYTKLYMSGQKNLRGVIRGWVEMRGQGSSPDRITGRGQVQISPAELYELPILVQVFNELRFVPPNKSAFNYALLNFDIANRQFRFNNIFLNGHTISLRGRGTAGFDSRLRLQFFSKLPPAKWPFPLVNHLIDLAGTGWVGVEVTGKADSPRAKIKSALNIDDAMKSFLNALPPPITPLLPLHMPPRAASRKR